MGGGYGPIEGGIPGEAVQAISNSKPSRIRAKYKKDDALLTELNSALEAKDVLTAWTTNEDYASEDVKKLTKKYGAYHNHAYSFTSVDVDGGLVHLRNPWGSSHPKPMPVADFKKIYPNIDINKAN